MSRTVDGGALDAALEEELATLDVDGERLELVRLDGVEGVSRLFRLEAICVRPGDRSAPIASLLGTAAELTLRRTTTGAERTMRGLVTRAEERWGEHGFGTLQLEMRPAAYPLTLGRASRAFLDEDVPGIVRKVMASAGVPARFSLTGAYVKRPYTVQHQEDDWSFVCRLCEDEGIYYWFDHAEGSILVFADTSLAAAPIDGDAVVAFAHDTGLTSATELVYELGSDLRAASTKFAVKSFDPGDPSATVDAADGEDGLEVYDAPGAGPRDVAGCRQRAQVMREAAIAGSAGVAGATTSVRLVPGRVVQIEGHPAASLDGRWFVTESEHHVVERIKETPSEYVCRFRAIPAGVTFRAPLVTPAPSPVGIETGVVIGPGGSEVHPDDTGRVRVQMHWDREGARNDRSGTWMRVAQRGTAGSMLLPRIGWAQLTWNEEGAPDAPQIMSRLPDGEHIPPYGLPGNMTRLVFKTATTPGGGSFNEVHFEDQKGSEEMFIEASRDMAILVQNTKTEQVGHDASRSIGRDRELEVTEDFSEGVTKNQSITIGTSELLDVKGDRTTSIGANETLNVGSSRTLKVGALHTTSVSGTRSLRVGSLMLDATLGNISAYAGSSMSTTVGGAVLKATASAISESSGGVSAVAVGGVAVDLTKKIRSIDVRGKLVETVGGLMLLKSGKSFSESATTVCSYKASLSKLKAVEIVVDATDSIDITCGGTAIKITAEGIEVSSPSIDLDGASLAVTAPKIEHN